MLYLFLEIFCHVLFKTEFPGKGVDVTIIPIPWNVSDPSKVLILWSTLSPANCVNTFGYAFMTEFPIGWLATTDFLNLFTSEYEIGKPKLNSSLTSYLDPNTWSHAIPRRNNSGVNAVCGRDA